MGPNLVTILIGSLGMVTDPVTIPSEPLGMVTGPVVTIWFTLWINPDI